MRPHFNAKETPLEVEDRNVQLCKELPDLGSGAGASAPAPKKRPKSSSPCLAAELPNECWDFDKVRWQLEDGT